VDSAKRTKITTAGAVAIFWVVVGVLACYGATQLGLGSVTDPGAGFIFFWSGLILMLLSLVVLLDAVRSAEPTIVEMGALNWTKIALILISLSSYGFLLERLGFVLTTFVFLSFLLGCIQGVTWGRSLATSVAATLACYGIFELWLKIRLPKGILGF
jgi:putative tricarboxylic transport membrane protein